MVFTLVKIRRRGWLHDWVSDEKWYEQWSLKICIIIILNFEPNWLVTTNDMKDVAYSASSPLWFWILSGSDSFDI